MQYFNNNSRDYSYMKTSR